MELSIIILSYNTKDLILQCIKSIIKQYQKELESKKIEIIIVDNNSSDDSAKIIKYYVSHLRQDFGGQASIKYGGIKLIENKENVGFAKGCNLGARNAEGKYLLFLNSDTEVRDRGFLQMTDFLEKNKSVGILGGKLLNYDNTLQPSGGNFYNLWNLFLMLIGGERLGFVRKSAKKEESVDWVSGACMMIKRELFGELGGFDEYFFMYIEDMEICFRAKKLGFLTYFFPNLALKHKSLGSSNRAFAIINIYKGILHFYSKHKSYFEYLIAKTLLILKARILILVGLLTFNTGLRDRYKKAIA